MLLRFVVLKKHLKPKKPSVKLNWDGEGEGLT